MEDHQRFIARQPILNAKQEVYAYELLFRSSMENLFQATDGDTATSQLIADSFLLFGIESLIGRGKAFINITERLLLDGAANLLPKHNVVIELLETIEPREPVIDACRSLAANGYKLALDDFVFAPKYMPLIELAHIIKVDLLESSPTEVAALAKRLDGTGTVLLAEKVETQREFEQSKKAGCSLFQGFFFSKPVIISRKELPPHKHHYLRLLKEVNSPEMSYDNLANLVQSDVSLSLKLLQYINSSFFGVKQEIRSLQHALAYLGEEQIRKWATIMTLGQLAEDRPEELLRLALIRARFAELVAERSKLADRAGDLFLLGMFSLLDAMLGRPIRETTAELPIAEDLRGALCGEVNPLRAVLELIMSYEKGDWADVQQLASQSGIAEKDLAGIYASAIQYGEEVFCTLKAA
ncbi:MAG: HDOD domain-containing protein [Candidatus Hydrogenedentota bacterium]